MVERKKLNQWFFNISKFSDELLEGLDSLNEWPNKVKIMQKNWIGKSLGCEVNFEVQGNLPIKEISCFTTRPDTLFGLSFFAVSVDHPLSKFYENDPEFKRFRDECSKTGTTEESIAQAEKIGFKTNLLAINPLNPDENLRSRDRLGMVMMHDFAHIEGNVWDNGSLYDAKSGKTYTGMMTLKDENTLDLRGYIGFSFIGRSSTWTRKLD